MAQFSVVDVAPGFVTVAPLEGPGADSEYFKIHRLCDATTDLTTGEWQKPLLNYPRRPDPDAGRPGRLTEAGNRLVALNPDNASQFAGLSAHLTGLTQEDLVPFLQKALPEGIFDALPNASLWLMTASDVLLGRLALLRGLAGLRLTPDIPLGDEFKGFGLLATHSFSSGVDFSQVCNPALLAFSPQSYGLAFAWPPHALILLFGEPFDLRRPQPDGLSDLYEPRSGNQPIRIEDERFALNLPPAEVELLLHWWVEQLNVLYSHAADPTRFGDRLGHHQPQSQMGWLLTLERLMVDVMLLQANPTAPGAVHTQLAFDLLDKAETLAGYRSSGEGFSDLLRNGTTLPRLRRTWQLLPEGQLPERFRKHAQWAYDTFYVGVREGVVAHRLKPGGVIVDRGDPAESTRIPDSDYIPELVRAVRNSAHGLLGQLTAPDQERERRVIATHSGQLPWQLGDVACCATFGALGDARRLCDGSWRST
jgi:hypothetical protein